MASDGMTAEERDRTITPGPWKADMSSGILKIVGPADAKKYKQREVCRIYGGTRANVKLLEAAPDLLAACEAVMEFLSNGTPVHPGALVQAEVFNAIRKVRSL